MSPEEIVLGYVPGTADTPAIPDESESETARESLERLIGDALRRPPCAVAFSGGRDSSLILALACHVARRDGLPEPIALTNVFPEADGSDEREWQELVIRHLGVEHWERVEMTDELDLIGPLAGEHLLRHGVVWPPTIHVDVPMMERLRGGVVLDGEGGDEVLGVEQHRVGPITHLVRIRRPLSTARLASAAAALGPAWARERHEVKAWHHEVEPAWLTDAGVALVSDSLRAMVRSAPLRFSASVRAMLRRRAFVLMLHNRKVLASGRGVSLVSPLLDPEVVSALAREGGNLGIGGRGWVITRLAGDLLPGATIARESKAHFGGAFWTERSRCFARDWSGAGVDPEFVIPDVLRDLWRSGPPNALTAALLQQAWLSTMTSPTSDAN
jgi:asparagine synthetase B (glutamine-hydrolysing)